MNSASPVDTFESLLAVATDTSQDYDIRFNALEQIRIDFHGQLGDARLSGVEQSINDARSAVYAQILNDPAQQLEHQWKSGCNVG